MNSIVNQEIESAITGLKNCNGIFSISTLVLKEVKLKISDLLSYVYNLCIVQGYFPEELKIGCITPIYKKGDRHNIENYRPICSLSQFSKILERIIYNRMIVFIDNNNILSSNQFGFRKGLSTESAIIQFIDKIHNGLNKRHHTIAVFMDLSKAFDVLDHNILSKN